MTTKTYQISDTTGNQAIDGGSDLARARVHAQSLANKWGTDSYLCERGAAEDDFETFAPLAGANKSATTQIISRENTMTTKTAASENLKVRIFRGDSTKQISGVDCSKADPELWYYEPADYDGDVLWSKGYGSRAEAYHAAGCSVE